MITQSPSAKVWAVSQGLNVDTGMLQPGAVLGSDVPLKQAAYRQRHVLLPAVCLVHPCSLSTGSNKRTEVMLC